MIYQNYLECYWYEQLYRLEMDMSTGDADVLEICEIMELSMCYYDENLVVRSWKHLYIF